MSLNLVIASPIYRFVNKFSILLFVALIYSFGLTKCTDYIDKPLNEIRSIYPDTNYSFFHSFFDNSALFIKASCKFNNDYNLNDEKNEDKKYIFNFSYASSNCLYVESDFDTSKFYHFDILFNCSSGFPNQTNTNFTTYNQTFKFHPIAKGFYHINYNITPELSSTNFSPNVTQNNINDENTVNNSQDTKNSTKNHTVDVVSEQDTSNDNDKNIKEENEDIGDKFKSDSIQNDNSTSNSTISSKLSLSSNNISELYLEVNISLKTTSGSYLMVVSKSDFYAQIPLILLYIFILTLWAVDFYYKRSVLLRYHIIMMFLLFVSFMEVTFNISKFVVWEYGNINTYGIMGMVSFFYTTKSVLSLIIIYLISDGHIFLHNTLIRSKMVYFSFSIYFFLMLILNSISYTEKSKNISLMNAFRFLFTLIILILIFYRLYYSCKEIFGRDSTIRLSIRRVYIQYIIILGLLIMISVLFSLYNIILHMSTSCYSPLYFVSNHSFWDYLYLLNIISHAIFIHYNFWTLYEAFNLNMDFILFEQNYSNSKRSFSFKNLKNENEPNENSIYPLSSTGMAVREINQPKGFIGEFFFDSYESSKNGKLY